MRNFSLLFLNLIVLLSSSCQSQTATGAFTGAVLGTGIGVLAGGREGALIGGATGILAGGGLGAILDEQDRKVMQQTSPRTVDRMDRGDPLTVNDIIKLSQSGISDEVIIAYIRENAISYHLREGQVRRLREAGVSRRVIYYMKESGR